MAACLFIMLTGCAVGPDYKAPAVAVPVAWANADKNAPTQRPVLTDWWTSLGDATLTSLIEEAVSRNLDVAKAKAKVREARATRRQKVGTLAPSVEATASDLLSKVFVRLALQVGQLGGHRGFLAVQLILQPTSLLLAFEELHLQRRQILRCRTRHEHGRPRWRSPGGSAPGTAGQCQA